MRKRTEDVAETRPRIVEAAVRLCGTIGPAATTISALAEEARVTRLIVYRHFPDNWPLFAACSARRAPVKPCRTPRHGAESATRSSAFAQACLTSTASTEAPSRC